MSIKTLQELCTVNVVENFKTNNVVISIYDLGDKVCRDISDRLLKAKKIDASNIERLQFQAIESLKIDEHCVSFSDTVKSWIFDIVFAGLIELDIGCIHFNERIAKEIVNKCEKKNKPATKRSNNSEGEELQTLAVTALQTLRIEEHGMDPTLNHLTRMLTIFAGTLKHLQVKCFDYGTAEGSREFLDTIGTLCLDKLYLRRIAIYNTHSCAVTPSMQHLKTLKLDDIGGLTDQYIVSLLEVAGQNLQHLCIKRCNSVTDATLQNIQRYCPNLVSLALSGNEKLTKAGLEQFVATASLKKLQRLKLQWMNSVTDVVVARLVDVGQLIYVNLYNCPNVTLRSLPVLASIQTLKYVELDLCYRLDSKNVDDFMTRHGLDHCRAYHKLHPDNW